MKSAIEKYLNYLNSPPTSQLGGGDDRKNLFDEAKKCSLQVVLHKIPNLINEKSILCKLPHPMLDEENMPEVCLIVKDVDKKDRDYERTVRKYTQIVQENNLENVIKKIIPLKQLNLEFRPFEAKRVLSTSFDLFLADKCLHEILFGGSKLGKEFHKRRKMPIEIDVEGSANLHETVMNVLNSTVIRLSGKGAIIDINAFLSTHTAKEATENVEAIRAVLAKCLPGGEKNIKAMYVKSTNALALPVYADESGNANQVDLPNNMSVGKVKRSKMLAKKMKMKKKKSSVKRLANGGKAAKPTTTVAVKSIKKKKSK